MQSHPYYQQNFAAQQQTQQFQHHHYQGSNGYRHAAQQPTQANVPQASHVRVASSNSGGTNSHSYMAPQTSAQPAQHPHAHSNSHQSEAVKKISHLRKLSGHTSALSNAQLPMRKHTSQENVSGFNYQTKNTHSRQNIAHRPQSGTANGLHKVSSQQPQAPQMHFNQSPDMTQGPSHGAASKVVKGVSNQGSRAQINSHQAPFQASKSPRQPQMTAHQHNHQIAEAHSQINPALSHHHAPIQKRASPPSGTGNAVMTHNIALPSQHVHSQPGFDGANSNLGRKQVKLQHGAGSSSVLFSKGVARASNSPINGLSQAQIQGLQSKASSMNTSASQAANNSVSQKIKFLLRAKESDATPSQRQLTMKLSKQKSPKFVAEIDNNTQATFGVDENLKENRQINFQMAPHLANLAQESPSIGDEMNSGHPSLQPNISSKNLRGPLNFTKKQDQSTFGGLNPECSPKDTVPSLAIQTQEEENSIAPQNGIHRKQLSQNLRYQVAQSSTPLGDQALAAKAAKKKGAGKSPVHIHYHNHIQVINSGETHGAGVFATATPSKSPKQVAIVGDSLKEPRIQRHPSHNNIGMGPGVARPVTSRGEVQQPAQHQAPKRITIKQSGIQKAPSSSKIGLMSVTPRLATTHAQKSTPNLKSNLQVTTKPLKNSRGCAGVQNVSPAAKSALNLLGQGGVKSHSEIQFADQLNQKLLRAQQNEAAELSARGEGDLNTLTDSIDGSKVTSDALKNIQPIQSVTPTKLQHAASKKKLGTSVPPLKLGHGAKEANLQVTAQVSTSSSKPLNTGRVSHRLKQTRRKQVSKDTGVYKQAASQKSSLGNTSKARQTVLSSSGASSNSLKSLGLVTANASNKSANSILISELSKYINIRQQGTQKRFQPLNPKTRKPVPQQNPPSTRKSSEPGLSETGQDEGEIMENLRHFLFYLERRKIINITEVVQDKAKMQNLIQEIAKVDFKDFSKQSSQKFKKLRASSGSESNNSQNRVQPRSRQGTPVNMKTSAGIAGQSSAEPQSHEQNATGHVNLQNASASGATPRSIARLQQQMAHQHPAEHSGQFVPQSHPSLQNQQNQHVEHIPSSAEMTTSPALDSKHQLKRVKMEVKAPVGVNGHHVHNNLAPKEACIPAHQTNPAPEMQPQHQGHPIMATNVSSATGTTSMQMQGQHALGSVFHSTNRSSVAQMQHHYAVSSQYNTSNNYVSDSSNGGAGGIAMNQNFGDQLANKLSNVGASSRNKMPGGNTTSASQPSSSTIKTRHSNQANYGSSQQTNQQMSSSNEQIATAHSGQYEPHSHQNPHAQSSSSNQQKYANYKAVAVSQSKGQRPHRKGNSADPAQEHSSKKQFKISGLWDLANHQRGDSESGVAPNSHQRRASEGQIMENRARGGNRSGASATKETGSGHQAHKERRRQKSRGGSADQGNQREVLRLSRGSSAKRTAKEIVDYIVADEVRFRVNDNIMKERERLIKYNKIYLKKYKQLPPTSLEFYECVELIGKGAFGQVTLGIHKLTGRQVAIKAINKSYMQDTYSKQKVMQEVYILKKIRHSNIIRLFEVFQSPKHFLLVMEYADGGDLLQFVKKRQRLDEDTAKQIFKQVIFGIAHCHCRSVLHRDIKLDNILMDHMGSIKICDFGVSRLITKNQSIQEQCGTPAYLAPEIIADKGYRGYYVDLWSLGVLLYAMLQGTVPFKAKSLEALHALIMTGKLDFPQPISEPALNLIRSMLKIEPEERISIPNILRHPWLKTGDDLECDDEDDDHDFEMGISFRRQECNFNPLSMIGMSEPPSATRQKDSGADATEESHDEILLTEQETNPMHQIGNINVLEMDNLFHSENDPLKVNFDAPKETQGMGSGNKGNNRLTYDHYCAVTQDFGTHHIDEEALKVLEGFGYPRKLVIDSLNNGELNHATTCYNILVTQ